MAKNPKKDGTAQPVLTDYQAQAASAQYLLDNCPDTMYSLDRDYRYIAFNRRHASNMQTHYGVNISPGARILDLISIPADRETTKKYLDRALAGEQFVETMYWGDETHSRVFIRISHAPIKGEQGAVVGVSIHSEDLTDLKKAEEALVKHQNRLEELVEERTSQLKASEALYHNLFETMSSVIVIADPQTGAILDANQAACAFYGLPYAQMTNINIKNLVTDSAESVLPNMNKVVTGEISYLETGQHMPNGQTREVEIYTGLVDFKGQPALLGVLHDISERKRAQQALKQSEEKFKILFNNLPLPSAIYRLVYDQSGGIVDLLIEDANDFCAAAVRKSTQELKGKSVKEIHTQNIVNTYLTVCKEIKASGLFRMFEIYYEPHQRNYLTTAFMVSPDLFAIVNLDITEQKQAEQLLHENDERYRQLLDNTMDAILVTMPGVGIEFANPVAVGMFGWTEAELIHIDPKYLLEKSDPRLKIFLEERARIGHARGELTFIRKDGSKFLGEFSSSLFKGRDGMTRATLVLHDISERKQNEERLMRLSAIVESIEDAVICKSMDGTITSWNSGAERLYGYSAGQAVGHSISMLMPPDTQDDFYFILDIIRAGELLRNYETTRKAKDGRLLHVSLNISPMRTSTGEIVGVSTIAREISANPQVGEDAGSALNY